MTLNKRKAIDLLVVETAKNGNNLHIKLKECFQQNKITIMIIITLTITAIIIYY